MSHSKFEEKPLVLPLLPLRGLTVFPHMILNFDVGRVKSIKSLENAMVDNQLIFLVAQKDVLVEDPGEDDLYRIGTVARVKQLLKMPGENVRVLVEGLSRAELVKITETDPCFTAEITERREILEDDVKVQLEALSRQVVTSFEEFIKSGNKLPAELAATVTQISDPDYLADMVASNLPVKLDKKQWLLEAFSAGERLERLYRLLLREIDILEVEKEINVKVRKQIDKHQREYWLREQMKVIQNELGEKEGIAAEVDEYRERAAKVDFPEDVARRFDKEADRLTKMGHGSAESTVVRNYLDWLLDLPWNQYTAEDMDLDHARIILDEDHFGLEKVKQRIIEYLAVKKLTNTLKGPIICLVGPPGVGKTSIARSVARALNRKYVRMSLGGVRDEAEIRGHRKTYIGAMPGRLINAMKQAGSNNPLVLLDEIDKMSHDFRGDPASAMLEVLDGEQNDTFRDHYLEVPYSLKNVLFMTTANGMEGIPRPLMDRMEIIRIEGYTEEEKIQIALRHILPRQKASHGLTPAILSMDEAVLRDIISSYTREAGVRSLEREIGKICRKVAAEVAGNKRRRVQVTPKNLEKYLGTRRLSRNKAGQKDETGIATGLAWTSVGGDTLSIEVAVMDGTGRLELTGQLGDVMKESARAAMSWMRSNLEALGIAPDFYKKKDIHIHIPEGATPKDGPSAGITLATAMVSALSGHPVRHTVAMTGEITLRGRVLPIGGVKEKVLAAHRAGILTILLPEQNRKDLDDVPENIRKAMKFVFVESMEEVIAQAILRPKNVKQPPSRTETPAADSQGAGALPQ